MKDLNETLQRKCGVSLIYIQADLIFFSRSTRSTPGLQFVYIFCKFYIEELLSLVLRVNLISPLY